MYRYQLEDDPLPKEPPEFRIHSEGKKWKKVWVVTKRNKLQAVLPDRSSAQGWIDSQTIRKRQKL